MRALLNAVAALGILGALASPAQAAITLGGETTPIQVTTGTTCTTNTLALSSGALATVTITGRQSFTISGVAGTVNTTYSNAVSSGTALGIMSAIYYVQNSAAGTETVTVTVGQTITTALVCAMQEWEGAATSSVVDQTNTADNSSVTSHPHGSITTGASAGLILTIAGEGGTVTETVASGFTALNDGTFRYWGQYDISAVASTTTDGAFTTGTVVNTACAIASFNEAGGGGSPKRLLLMGVGAAL